MPEKNKSETEKKKEPKETRIEKDDRSEARKKGDYYYDDAHGYEVYSGDEEENQES